MAKINLELISEELANDGQKVISTEYTNLKTEMEFQCAEGHSVFATQEKIRARRLCPICEGNLLKDPKPVVIPKNPQVNRTLALDQATHITGYSVYDGNKLIYYGTYTARAVEEADRLHEINQQFISMIENQKPDNIGLEGIQYQEGAGVTTFQTLARLQGILMETCMQSHIPFMICPTNTWRAHCGVKGRSRADKKKSMQLLVKQQFDISVSDDCADAIGIGKYVAEYRAKSSEIISWE